MNFYEDIMKDSSDPENGGSEEEEYPDDYYDGDQLVYYSDTSIVDISDDGTHSNNWFRVYRGYTGRFQKVIEYLSHSWS
jgi:hypothetical protein